MAMTSLVHHVRSKMFILAHRRARGMLDGEYGSVFKGRSLDFDDLRAYVPGDEVRDIDWKASARHGSPLIRRYVAVRQHHVLLVADTGRNMAAESLSGELKKDIAVMALGVIGSLALGHGDPVGLVHGHAGGTAALPAASGDAALERLLRTVDAVGAGSAASAPEEQLEYVARTYRRRMLLFVVADESVPTERTERLLRRLRAQHEILWLTILDADLTEPVQRGRRRPDIQPRPLRDIEGHTAVIGPVAASARVLAAYELARTERDAARSAMLRSAGITEGRVGSADGVVSAIFALLERHRRGG